MFDILVDHPKKRLYLLLSFFCVLIIGSLCFELSFGISMLLASSFSEMMDLCVIYPNSFFAFFFYTLLTSPVLYSNDVLWLAFQIVKAVIISNNFCDWLSVLGILGLSFSHKNKMSKRTMAIQIGYFLLRFILVIGIVLFLYPTLMYNNATLALFRIHVVAGVLMGVYVMLLILLLLYLINIIKLCYIPLFKEADE